MRRHISFAAERTATNAGTWWFAPAGGFLATFIMWSLGIPISFSEWLPDIPALRSGFDVFVYVVVAYAFLFVFWIGFSILKGKIRLNPWIALTCIGFLALLVGISGYLWDQARGPIIWTWNYNSPLSFWRQGTDPLLVASLNIGGRNRSDASLRITSAIIRTKSLETIPLSIVRKGTPVPASGEILRAGESFWLHAPMSVVNPEWTGQEPYAETLKGQFNRFTFVFEYEGGKPYVVNFSPDDIAKYIAEADRKVVVATDH